MMRITLDTPLWLAALPLVGAVILLARRGPASGRPPGGQRAHRLATTARALAIALLVTALAGPRVGFAGQGVDVAFLVDVSDSAEPGRAAALEWVRAALAERGDKDRAALGLFGRQARLEHGLRGDHPGEEPAAVVDGSASNLEQALRLGQGALGSEQRRRVVLLTDGRQNAGDLLEGARALAEAGIGLDVVRMQGGVPSDLLVEQVQAPNRVRVGEAYEVTARLRNTGAQRAAASLTVLADGEVVSRQTARVDPGTVEVSIQNEATRPGTVRYEVRIDAAASTIAANDVASAAVRVAGPPKVLVYQREDGVADDLARALEAAGTPVEVRSADREALPPLDGLLEYDSVVLADMPAATLGDTGMAALQTYVRDAGHGLVVTGGQESFALGAYDGTPLEEVLPVFASVTDPRRRSPVAEALVVDTSGSMAACHCSDPGVSGPRPAGGINKTDISREAVARAIDALDEQDTVGVLAFNTTSEWVIPLQQLPAMEVVDEALARLHPDGNTSIGQAVREAIDGLLDTAARLRHIVLFTDGFTDTDDLVEVAEEAAEAGITVSVVGTGEGPPELRRALREMAEAGGGRFYPGRDLQSIPNILALEVRLAVRPIVNEGRFHPVVTGSAPPTADLAASPPLRGYVATTSKPAARTLLRIGEERDPLLATWQAGLGTTAAWTSDVAPRWSAEWVSWDRFSSFWAAVVRDTFPAEEDRRGSVTAAAGADGFSVRVDTASVLSADVEATAGFTRPDGQRVEVPLERVALDAFETTVDAAASGLSDEGVYAVSVRIAQGEEDLYRGTATAIRSYPAEYAMHEADPGLLERAVAVAEGRLDPEPATVFDPEGLAAGESARPLWPWLATLALALIPVDVGFRRLRLESADLPRARAWLAGGLARITRRRRPEMAERSAATDALLAAKRRARGGATRDHGEGSG